VQDGGVGPKPDFQFEQASTLGLRLMRMFAKQLRTHVTLRSERRAPHLMPSGSPFPSGPTWPCLMGSCSWLARWWAFAIPMKIL